MSDEEKTTKDTKDDDARDTSGDKKVDVEAKATVSDDEGEKTHEVDVKATADVRDLREKQAEKAAAEDRDTSGDVTIMAGGTRITIQPGVDVDDASAHEAASHAADRPTAKVAAPAASFGSRGRPD